MLKFIIQLIQNSSKHNLNVKKNLKEGDTIYKQFFIYSIIMQM